MDNRHNKVNWEKGLFITPEILNANDDFFLHKINILGSLSILKSYGIFPSEAGKYNCLIEAKIGNNKIVINQLICLAVTKNGHIIDFNNDLEFPCILELDRINNGDDVYVVLGIDPYNHKRLQDSEYAIPKYSINLKQINNITEYEIPVMKIKNIGNYNWEIDEDYIFPSITLSSCQRIYKKYQDIIENIKKIPDLEIKNDNLLMQVYLFQTEFENYLLSETPYDFILSLKKLFRIFVQYSEIELSKCNELLNLKYDHLQISNLLNMGAGCLDEIIENLKIKVVKPKEPEGPIIDVDPI